MISKLARPASAALPKCRAFGTTAGDARLKNKTRVGVWFSRFQDRPGIASDVLAVCRTNNLNLTHLESKLFNYSFDGATIEFDIDGLGSDHPKIQDVVARIRALGVQADIKPAIQVPWFPLSRKEVDLCVDEVISAESGGLLAPDHPGFQDEGYRLRREKIAEIANSYRWGDGPIPKIQYTDDEIKTWGAVYERLEQNHDRWACDEFKEVLPELKKEAGYGKNQIPQLNDISEYLKTKTGFCLRPVCGLLSARDFLNALAFRTFCSTQYIRHHGNPFYTPEPDICHELIGHVPLLADAQFAEFTQKVGLASLGASDEEIVKLANIYWFTVEFGLVKSELAANDPEDSGIRAMGAGILSSFGEMEWACAGQPSEECREMGGISKNFPKLMKPKVVPFIPQVAATTAYPITTYQPQYFIGESMREIKESISDYCDSINRKFYPVFDPMTGTVNPSRHVQRLSRTSTAEMQGEKQKEFFDNLQKIYGGDASDDE